MCLSMFVVIGVTFLEGSSVEVRSLIPYHVKMMALTATATAATGRRISLILGMREPSVISASPVKANVCYWVNEGVSVHDL